jgi:plasmid stabilization system protein ParE
MAEVKISRRAAREIRAIKRVSVAKWGEAVAADYIASIEQALVRLGETPELLKSKEGVSPYFGFYRVQKHFLVGTVAGDHVYVLAVKHGSMDLPNRIGELEPQLALEAKLLDQVIKKKSEKPDDGNA